MESSELFWLILHLGALTLAYGTVIIVDSIGALWLFGRIGRQRMLKVTAWAQMVIWPSLAVMLVSGAALGPDLTKPLTRIKMGLVIALLMNGVNLHMLRKRTAELSGQSFWEAPNSYKAWSVASITLSQLLWISTIIAGYIITHSS